MSEQMILATYTIYTFRFRSLHIFIKKIARELFDVFWSKIRVFLLNSEKDSTFASLLNKFV